MSQQPPQPPKFNRQIQLPQFQQIGVPLLFLLPVVLALLGVFGETFNTVSESNTALEMQVNYATRYRYKQVNPVEVSITNTSSQPLATLTVEFDADYIDQFSNVSFAPSVTMITEEAYQVELTDIQPGETRQVSVELQGEHYWQHSGTIRASAEGIEPVAVTIRTFIFP